MKTGGLTSGSPRALNKVMSLGSMDERTARKAYLSNALDAGAREIRALKDALATHG